METEVEVSNVKLHMKQSTFNRVSNTIIYVILGFMTVIWLFPFIALVFESFRVGSFGPSQSFIPDKWGIENYVKLFTGEYKFLRWYLNTLVLGCTTAIFQSLFVLMMAYTLSRLRFKGRKALMRFMLILGMFPGFVSMIVIYTILKDWGMTNKGALFGLMLTYFASSGMGYYVAKGFFDTIPRSLDEAARIDGATRFQVFYKIILPLSKPIIIYTVLTAFMAPWGDFIFSAFISRFDPSGMTVGSGLWNLIRSAGSIDKNYTLFCAGGVLVAIPVTVLFMFLQRYYVEGVTGGAVKG